MRRVAFDICFVFCIFFRLFVCLFFKVFQFSSLKLFSETPSRYSQVLNGACTAQLARQFRLSRVPEQADCGFVAILIRCSNFWLGISPPHTNYSKLSFFF